MSYKVVIEHTIKPGKYQEVLEWIKQKDEKRKAEDADYRSLQRYISVTGDLNCFVFEMVIEDLSVLEEPWAATDWGHEHLFTKVESRVFKSIEL